MSTSKPTPFASMAAFKAHCSLGFWKGGRPVAEEAAGPRDKAMGQFGRITALSDLPSKKILSGYVKEAMKLNDAGVEPVGKSGHAPIMASTSGHGPREVLVNRTDAH